MGADIQLRHFFVRASGDRTGEEALNRFLRGHHVLEVRQEFVADGANSMWYIAVRYAELQAETNRGRESRRSAVDYKDVLEPEAFARFVELRERRKAIAEEEELPAFAVFTDKELAAIAEVEDPKRSDLKGVKGIGVKKIERFGARILNEKTEENEGEAGRSVV